MANPRKERAAIDALFVQSGSAFSSDDGEITLHGLAEATVYFADRPRREAGHMPSRRVPRALGRRRRRTSPSSRRTRSSPSSTSRPKRWTDVVVVLHEPRLAGDELTYRVDVLNGTLPPAGGPCSLFIDTFGRSLAPVSVRGLRRPRRTSASQAAA